MKTYEEILKTMEKLGIIDDKTNLAYAGVVGKEIASGTYDVDKLNSLSPDYVNNHDFWKIIDEKFNHSVIGKITDKDPNEKIDIELINSRNLCLAHYTNVLSATNFTPKDGKVLEIGPGYGGIRDYLKMVRPDCKYTGLDVNPKIPEAVLATERGTMPEDLKKEKFDLIICSNVFQHMSRYQFSAYIKDSFECLNDRGIFSFNFTPATKEEDCFVHYGQVTFPPFLEIITGQLLMYRMREISRTLIKTTNMVGLCFQKP